jgi:hypothetical protein
MAVEPTNEHTFIEITSSGREQETKQEQDGRTHRQPSCWSHRAQLLMLKLVLRFNL